MRFSKLFYAVTTAVLISAVIYTFEMQKNGQGIDTAEQHSQSVNQTAKIVQDNEFATREGVTNLSQNEKELREQVVKLGNDVMQLKQELSGLKNAIQGLNLASNQSVNPVMSQDEEKQHHEAVRSQEEVRLVERNQDLETRFRKQSFNANWSAKTKTLIKNSLQDEQVAIADIISIECRSSMCRVELSLENQEEASKLAMLPMKIGTELPNMMVNQTQDSTVLYLSKAEVAS